MISMNYVRERQGWGVRAGLTRWLRRMVRLRRGGAAVWQVTPDGKMIRM